jgi:hypothetical protein
MRLICSLLVETEAWLRYFFAGAGVRGQVQRAGFGTSLSAASMCSPQPSQVGLRQMLQVIL